MQWKMRSVLFAVLLSAGAFEASAFGLGWADSGISPKSLLSNAQPQELVAFDGCIFDEPINETNSWSVVRFGLGGSRYSFGKYVFSLPWRWTNVYGIQAELLPCDCDVYGLQLCAVGAANNLAGIECSMGNYVYREATGLQLGVAFSVAKELCGVQLGGFCAMTDNAVGLQASLLASGARTSACGVQLAGIVNSATECNGLQLGLFNFADRGKVVQVGLWNVFGAEGAERRCSMPLFHVGWR